MLNRKTKSEDKILEKFDLLESRLTAFEDKFSPIQLEIKILEMKDIIEKSIELSKQNISRVNMMANELKGVVSMARAALNEGKNFTEMLEIPNVLRTVASLIPLLEEQVMRVKEFLDPLRWSGFTQEEHKLILKALGCDPNKPPLNENKSKAAFLHE